MVHVKILNTVELFLQKMQFMKSNVGKITQLVFGQLDSYSLGNEDKCAAFYGETNEEQKQFIIKLFSLNKKEVYEIKEACDCVISLNKIS